jgi:tRNA threonylcarbamoyladenosine biosynthesis protein TsaE
MEQAEESAGHANLLIVRSRSETETRGLAARLARLLRGGELIGLRGDLGSGKTVFVRGLAEGLHISPRKVRSPSFTLINEYTGGRLPLYHVDLYRLTPSAADRVALREYLDGAGVCVIEWIEHLGEDLLRLDVQFTFVGENERAIVASARGTRYDTMLHQWQDG